MAVKPKASDIYDRMNAADGMTPANATLFTDWAVEAGDVLKVKQEGTTYDVPVYTNRMKWNGAPVVEIESTGNTERTPIAKASRNSYGGGGGAAKTADDAMVAYVVASAAEGRVDIVATSVINMQSSLVNIEASLVSINASIVSIAGSVTASAIQATIGSLEYLDLSGMLYADGGIRNTGSVYTDYLACANDVDALNGYFESVFAKGSDVATELAYFTNASAATSGSVVTLTFALGNGSSVSVNFSKTGTVTGASMSALNSATETEERQYIATGTITVHTSSGNVVINNVNVDVTGVWNQAYEAAKAVWYAAGWAAARAKCSYSESGGHGIIYFPPATVDGQGVASHWFGNTVSMNKQGSSGGGVKVRAWSYARHSKSGLSYSNIDNSYLQIEETYYP